MLAVLGSGCSAQAEGDSASDGIARLFSPAFRETEAKMAALRAELATLPEAPPNRQSERRGWRCHFSAKDSRVPRWVEMRFPRTVEFDSVVLVPVDVPYKDAPSAGHGFPVRFRVEAVSEEEPERPAVLADYSEYDFPNPGRLPVFIPTPGARAKTVRVVMTKPWIHGDTSFYALGEVFILSGKKNIVVGLNGVQVATNDSLSSGMVWSVTNLGDEQSVLGVPLTSERTTGYGYHSDISKTPEQTRWVQVDLGQSFPLDEVRLLPAYVEEWPDRGAFGFPARFRLEISNDPDCAEAVLLFERREPDFPNPAENFVTFGVNNLRARYVRFTATKLWERKRDYTFALAELQAWSGGKNVALQRPVTCRGELIGLPMWTPNLVTDGSASSRKIAEWPEWLSGLSRRREAEQQLAGLAVTAGGFRGEGLSRAMWMSAGVLALVVMGALAWSYRARRTRSFELVRMRERIARDLHDEIGSNLGAIALASEMALLQAESGSAAHDEFSRIRRTAQRTSDAMRTVVWLLRPQPGDLLAQVRETAEAQLRGLEWTIEGPKNQLPAELSLNFQRHILLAGKEILQNVARHSQTTAVKIRMEVGEGNFVLTVEDEGVGFDPVEAGSGSGLRNLVHRARELGGKLEIRSARGKGATVTLSAPIS